MLIVNRDSTIREAIRSVNRAHHLRHFGTVLGQTVARMTARIGHKLSVINELRRIQPLQRSLQPHTTSCVVYHQPACGC